MLGELTLPQIFELHYTRSGGDVMAAVHAVIEAELCTKRLAARQSMPGDEEIDREARRIAIAVGRELAIPFALMRSPTRAPRVHRGRGIAMLFVRERTRMSYPLIGGMFDRDHSSVIAACHVARRLLIEKPDLRERIDAVVGVVGSAVASTVDAERRAA